MTNIRDRVKINDRLLVIILFVIMVVLSVVQFTNLNENTNQTIQLRKAVTGQREWAEIGALCVLDTSGAINFQKIPYTPEAVEKYLKECFDRVSAERGLSESVRTPTSTTILPTTTTVKPGG